MLRTACSLLLLAALTACSGNGSTDAAEPSATGPGAAEPSAEPTVEPSGQVNGDAGVDGTDAHGTDAGNGTPAPAVDAGAPATPDSGPSDPGGCSYPAGAADPLALNAVIPPFQWPSAIASNGTDHPLDLAQAHCDTDPNIDWSPFDALLFIAIPAW